MTDDLLAIMYANGLEDAARICAQAEQITRLLDAQAKDTKEIEFLHSQITRLREALVRAAEMISGEYCSHRSPCGADNQSCYARLIYLALRETETKP